jgi:hypothetical protein
MGLLHQKYGHLTVIGKLEGTGGKYLTKCDCGNVKEVRGKYLTAGRVKTCGNCELGRRLMATKGRIRAREGKAVSLLYNRYIKREVERGSTYMMDLPVFTRKIQENCAFCGRSPLQRKKGPRIPYHDLVILDRSQVVTEDSWVSCCNTCERWKGQSNYVDFLEHVYKIISHIEQLKNSN